jgi:ribosomal protein L37AE/L43A
MIVKERETPLVIKKLQSLVRRLPSNHAKFAEIIDDLSKRTAGYNGELSIDYPLSFLPAEDYFIFHDLRLYHDPHFFQIDTLLISRKFIYVIDVKNIAGALYFDRDLQQLVRVKDGVQEVLPDPITQMKRHESLLQGWLTRNRLVDIPVVSAVVLSNPLSHFRSTLEHPHLSQVVIHRDAIPDKINQLSEKFLGNQISSEELNRLIELLKEQCIPLDPAVLEKYQISVSALKLGVLCPHCSHSPLPRLYGTWLCPRCKVKCKDAHVTAFIDYAMLFGQTITNQEAREFLMVDSAPVVKRLLLNMKFPFAGSNKGRVYHLSHLRK